MLKKYFISFCLLLSSPVVSTAAMIQEEYPVIVLGSGVGALTSAIYLARAGVSPLVITGSLVGGAINQSHSVQNWPGELDISGVALSERIRNQAIENGVIFLNERVVDVDFSKSPFVITTKALFGHSKNVKQIKAQACIIALGASPKVLNIPGESAYWSRGVYSCAVCDGALYKDKVVAVVGGGDSALTEAHYLSNIARKVYILVRSDRFRSVEKERMQEILARDNVEVLYTSEVKEVQGNDSKVTHLVIENGQDHNRQKLAVDALFLAIGSTPNTELFQGKLELDPQGYIALKQDQQTSVPNVYAVGDVADSTFNQAITAAGDGAKAALQAHRHLRPQVTLTKAEKPKNKSMPLIEIQTKQELAKILAETKGAVILDFYGNFCGPCRTFAPQYEAWAEEFRGKITFAKVNVEKSSSLCEAFQIQGIPTLIILDHEGNVVRRSTGIIEIAEVGKQLNAARESDRIDPAIFK